MDILVIVVLGLIGIMFLMMIQLPIAYLRYRWRQKRMGLGAETMVDWVETEYQQK